MRRIAIALATMLMVAFGVTACGSTDTSTADSGTGDSAAQTNDAAPTACPTVETKGFAKTRFVADVGIVVGTFHHFIYNPYKAGSFTKGTKHYISARVKAGVAALAIAKFASNAVGNAKADPALCNAVAGPLGKVATAIGGLKGSIIGGNLGSIATTEGLVGTLTSAMSGSGNSITETIKGISGL